MKSSRFSTPSSILISLSYYLPDWGSNIFWICFSLITGGTFSVMNTILHKELMKASCQVTFSAQKHLSDLELILVDYISDFIAFFPFVLMLVNAVFLLARSSKLRELHQSLAILLTLWVDCALKLLYSEPRPIYKCQQSIRSVPTCPKDLGMPSGHVLFVTVLYLHVAAYWIKPKIASKIWRWFLYFCCAICIGIVFCSRVILGAHSISQVIMGFFFGVLFFNAAQIASTLNSPCFHFLSSFAFVIIVNLSMFLMSLFDESQNRIPSDWEVELERTCGEGATKSKFLLFQFGDLMFGASGNLVFAFFIVSFSNENSIWRRMTSFAYERLSTIMIWTRILVLLVLGLLLITFSMFFPSENNSNNIILLRFCSASLGYFLAGVFLGLVCLFKKEQSLKFKNSTEGGHLANSITIPIKERLHSDGCQKEKKASFGFE